MFRSSKITMVLIAVQVCSYAYSQTLVVLPADTPVRVRTVQSISPAMQVGQYVECQAADAVWVGKVIAIPRGAIVIGELAKMHKFRFRQAIQIEIKFIYVRAASGERVPLRSGQDLRADWLVRLVNGSSLPIGAETKAYVSRDMEVNTVVATGRPGGIDHVGEAKLVSAADLFQPEIGQPKIRLTEVRPICRRRAISALLMPARCSFRISDAFRPGRNHHTPDFAIVAR